MSKQTTTALQVASPQSGEMPPVLYFQGTPKQYRFDGQKGSFNIHGKQDIGKTFTFHPLAWRIFDDSLFGRERARWAEFFFVDEAGCLSTIMFNNSSVTELNDLVPQLGYDQKKLSDVALTITTDKKTNEKGSWYIAKFDYKQAPQEAIDALEAFAAAHPVYREDTITASAEYRFFSDTYAMAEARRIALEKSAPPAELEESRLAA